MGENVALPRSSAPGFPCRSSPPYPRPAPARSELLLEGAADAVVPVPRGGICVDPAGPPAG